MTAVIQLKPEGRYTNADLERLANELIEYVRYPDVMRTKQAAEFLGIGKTKMYQMDRIPSHNIPGITGKFYLKSELIEFIKKH